MRNLKTKRSAVCHWNKKISNIEESVFEQNKLLQSSEKSSENVLEIIDKEIKVDIKNSKEELRKQRVGPPRRSASKMLGNWIISRALCGCTARTPSQLSVTISRGDDRQ